MMSSLSPSYIEFATKSIFTSILNILTCGKEEIDYEQEEDEAIIPIETEEVEEPEQTIECPDITNIDLTPIFGPDFKKDGKGLHR